MIKDIIFQGDDEVFTVTGKVISDENDTIVFQPLTEAVDYIPEHIPDGFILSSDYAVEFGEMACLTKIYTEVYSVSMINKCSNGEARNNAEQALNAFGKQFGLTHIIKGLKENG